MAVMQYVGARYVPKFFDNPAGGSDWAEGVIYEPLTVVTYMQNSYTSKKTVPATVGAPNENLDYWAPTGNYNGQVEEYRRAVDGVVSGLSDLSGVVDGVAGEVTLVNGRVDTVEGSVETLSGTVADNTEAIGTLNGEVATLNNGLEEANEEIEKLKYKDVGFRMALYIDAVNGSDDNDGLTIDAPMATLQHAYETAYATGYNDITFLFLSGGTYTLDDRRLTNTSIHFTTNFTGGGKPGVKVVLGDGSYAPYFYNSYIHFSGIASNKIEVSTPAGIHTDGADVYVANAHITGAGGTTNTPWDIANSNLNIVGCEVDGEVTLYVRGGFMRIEGTNKFNWTPANEQSAIRGQNAFMAIFGTMEVTPLTADCPADKWFIQCQVGVLRIEPRLNGFSTNGFKFTNHAVRIRGGFGSWGANVRADLASTSLTGTNIPDGGGSVLSPAQANAYVEPAS